jgi:hypothetical protein
MRIVDDSFDDSLVSGSVSSERKSKGEGSLNTIRSTDLQHLTILLLRLSIRPSPQANLPAQHEHNGEPSSSADLSRSQPGLHPPAYWSKGRRNAIARCPTSVPDLSCDPRQASVLGKPIPWSDMDDQFRWCRGQYACGVLQAEG